MSRLSRIEERIALLERQLAGGDFRGNGAGSDDDPVTQPESGLTYPIDVEYDPNDDEFIVRVRVLTTYGALQPALAFKSAYMTLRFARPTSPKVVKVTAYRNDFRQAVPYMLVLEETPTDSRDQNALFQLQFSAVEYDNATDLGVTDAEYACETTNADYIRAPSATTYVPIHEIGSCFLRSDKTFSLGAYTTEYLIDQGYTAADYLYSTDLRWDARYGMAQKWFRAPEYDCGMTGLSMIKVVDTYIGTESHTLYLGPWYYAWSGAVDVDLYIGGNLGMGFQLEAVSHGAAAPTTYDVYLSLTNTIRLKTRTDSMIDILNGITFRDFLLSLALTVPGQTTTINVGAAQALQLTVIGGKITANSVT